MQERGPGFGTNQHRINYDRPIMAGLATTFVSNAHEVAEEAPSPIGNLISLSKIDTIQENIPLVNSYGADIAAPFTLYFLLRQFKVNHYVSALCAFGAPTLFEALQFAERNNTELMDKYGQNIC